MNLRYLTIKLLKTCLFGAVLLASQAFFSPFCASEDYQTQVVSPFGCLNNKDNPLIIPDNMAQDLLNVEITPGGKSIKKREGYGVAHTLTNSTAPVHGIYNFYDSSGNEVRLFFNDRNIQSFRNGTLSTIYSTATYNSTFQCVDSLGFAYCVNSSRDALLKTNGISISAITKTDIGTMLSVTAERLAMAGFASYPDRLDFSKANDFTTWTTGAAATDPITFTITAPGSKITHITQAFARTMWFKDRSFGYVLSGPNQADWVVKVVSPDIGTLENTSVYDQGILYFKGQDGHIYSYDGSNLDKLTEDIQATIDLAQKTTQNSYSQSTQSEWDKGSYSNTSSTQSVGNVQLTLALSILRKNSGSGGANVYGCTNMGQGHIPSASYIFESFNPILAKVGSPNNYTLYLRADSGGTPGAVIGYTTIFSSSIGSSPSISTYTLTGTITLSADTTYWFQIVPDGTCNASHHLTWSYSSSYDASPAILDGSAVSNTFSYKTYGSTYIPSGVYYSSVTYAPNITTWATFEADYTNGSGGSQVFSIRASTGNFTVLSSTPSWTTIGPGSRISVSTGVWVQMKDAMTTTGNTSSPLLHSFTINWNEGSAVDKSYATYHDDAIWWSFTYGAGQTTNNRIIRYDLINRGSTLYDIASNGFFRSGNTLFFGDPAAGKVYQFGDVNSDNGSVINAYWKSKEFFQNSLFVDKEYNLLSLAAKAENYSVLTTTYTINNSSSAAIVSSLTDPDAYYIKINRNLPAGRVGSTISLRFGNNAAEQPFEIFGAIIGYRPKPWKVTPR